MQAITLEVILRAVFGVEDDERRQLLRRTLVGILATTRSPRAIGMTVDRLRRLPAYRRVGEMLAEADEILLAEIAERRDDPDLASREDILSLLVGARFEDGVGDERRRAARPADDPADGRPRDDGHRARLGIRPPVPRPRQLERLRAELAEGGHEYLDAVIEETLRLRPVVPFVGRELRVAAELDGYELPEGTVVMPSIYLAHTRPDSFPDPHAFRPERFLDGGPDTYSWIPFGGGTRRCIGAAFAQLEMRVVLRTCSAGPSSARPRVSPSRWSRNVTLSPRGQNPAILVERRPAPAPKRARVARRSPAGV